MTLALATVTGLLVAFRNNVDRLSFIRPVSTFSALRVLAPFGVMDTDATLIATAINLLSVLGGPGGDEIMTTVELDPNMS